jgi:hypothetical protein
MSALDAGQPPLDHCAVCRAAIRSGDIAVTVWRKEGQLGPDGDLDSGESERLASLCEACGRRYPAIRVLFGEQPPQ